MGNQKDLDKTLIAVLIAVIFLAWGFYPILYGLFVTSDNTEQRMVVGNTITATAAVEAELPLITEIIHSYKAGVHTYRGSVLAATACDASDAISAESIVQKESNPERFILVIVTNDVPEECVLEPTLKSFRLLIPGDERASVEGVVLNGKFVNVTIAENGTRSQN